MTRKSIRALALAAALLGAWACSDARAPERPHLFLITADALRADHLSLNGYARNTSPHLDALAAEAWNFTQAVTLIPKTGPSLASHLSGLPPSRHRVLANPRGIPQDVPLLAEMLREQGYDTAAFVSNPILAARKGFDRGFRRYEQFAKVGGLPDLVAAFVEFAREIEADRPVFVWLHLIDPHGPYTPPAEFRELFTGDALFRSELRTAPLDYEVEDGVPRNRVLGAIPKYQQIEREQRVAWYVSQYDAEIRYMDAAVGRVFEELRTLGLYEGAGILFTADHGESLGEHDYFFEHGWFTYDASVRVPLLVKPPGGAVAKSRTDQVSNLDTLPTLLGLAGLAAPPGLAGRNLLAASRPSDGAGDEGTADPAAGLLLQNPSSYRERYYALRTPHHKLVIQGDTDSAELYDLRSDPRETSNLAERDAARAAQMRAELERLRAELPHSAAPAPAPVVEPTAEERQQLKALGYLDP